MNGQLCKTWKARRGETLSIIKLPIHNLAIYSISLYVVLSVLFEGSQNANARLASYGLYLCLGMCISEVLLKQKIKIHSFTVCLLIFGVLLTISYFYSPADVDIKNIYLYRYWTSYLVIFFISNTIAGYKDIQKLLFTFVLAGVLLSLTLYHTYGFSNLLVSSTRIGDELGNQNMLGLYCAFSIVIAVYLFVTKKKSLFLLSAVVICIPAVMFTGSRKAVLLIAVALMSFFLAYSQNRFLVKRVLLLAILLLTMIILIESIPAFSMIRQRFENLFTLFKSGTAADVSDLRRLMFIKIGMQQFGNRFLLGNGFCYSYNLFGTYTHNNYIELLLNNGIVGAASYYSIHILLLIKQHKVRKYDRKVSSFVLMILGAVLFCDIGVITYYNRYILILITICVSLISLTPGKSGQ